MNATTTARKLDKIMERVRLLIARADHPTTPAPEAKLSRERAEKLMMDYRIEESSLSVEERAASGIRPVKREWPVCDLSSEFRMEYRSMLSSVLAHVDARAFVQYKDREGRMWLYVTAYGFESDLRYAEMIWSALALEFGARLEPEVRPEESDASNVYRMRSAGMERIRIAHIMGWGVSGSATAKVTRLFKAACAERSEGSAELLGRTNNVKTFRSSYALGFVSTIQTRLWNLRQSVGGSTMVLHSRREEVDEMYYTDHPEFRPSDKPALGSSEGTACARCAKAKSGFCRTHGYRKPSSRPAPALNYAGVERGRVAARTVDLGASAGRSVAR